MPTGSESGRRLAKLIGALRSPWRVGLSGALALAAWACGGDDGGGIVSCPGGAEPIPACADNGGCAGGESGRMTGMVDAHNRVRAAVENPEPAEPLPPLEWSDDLAAVAQNWAEHLASSGCDLVHSRDCRWGENLAWFSGSQPSAATVVDDGWASEEECYEYGSFLGSDSCSSSCDRSGGCGHYTQIIWRNTREVGCGLASCGGNQEVWVCNYAPAGNFVGQFPY